MAEKIIFLDFDGVLVNRRSLVRMKGLARGMEGRPSAAYAGDPDCVTALNHITEGQLDVRIVVSSMWRLDWGLADLRGLLKTWGVNAPAISKTPRLIEPSGNAIQNQRGKEIQTWLDDYPRDVESFVILDDDSDMGHLMPYLIKTQFEQGLTMQDAERAIAVLARKAGR